MTTDSTTAAPHAHEHSHGETTHVHAHVEHAHDHVEHSHDHSHGTDAHDHTHVHQVGLEDLHNEN